MHCVKRDPQDDVVNEVKYSIYQLCDNSCLYPYVILRKWNGEVVYLGKPSIGNFISLKAAKNKKHMKNQTLKVFKLRGQKL